MPQCQFPIFCCFCVSEKLHKKYSQNWTKQVPELLFFPDEGRGPKESRRGESPPEVFFIAMLASGAMSE
jgi:hypothetical protein